MKKLLLLSLSLTSVVLGAEPVPLFNAMLSIGKDHRFVLVDAAGKTSGFLKLGDSFEGYGLRNYDLKSGLLELERDGKTVEVTLVADGIVANGPVAATPATLADAEQVLRLMKIDDMMRKMAAQQKKTMEPMFDQIAASMLGRGQDGQFVAFQKKLMDEIMSVMAGPDVQAAMARLRRNVHQGRTDRHGGFYATPAGQAMAERQPELAQKLNEFLMPRMMQMMPRLQRMSAEFAGQGDAAEPQPPAAASR